MARTESNWVERAGSYLETSWPEGRNILINGTNKYLNFGATSGESGYGFRDNAGAMEFKDSGGSWAAFGSGAGYTNEEAQDAVGSILGAEFTYNDTTPSIVLATGGIDETKLDTSVNASLDLADSATQPGDSITTLDATAWRVFYSNSTGDVTELALGADGTFLKSNGATSAPSFGTPAGSGDVSKVGTPVNNQIAVWTGDGTIEGDTALTFDTTTDTLSTGILNVTSLTASELLATDASKNLVSLAVATYPSLTELTYVKGVTSAIQTQLGTKATGPALSTDNAITRFDSTTGKLLQNSTVLVGDTGNVTGLGTLNTHTIPGGTGTFALTSDIPSAGANTALSNLASVAINTSLVSDTDNTDDLGTTLKKWANLFVTTIGATATRVTKGWFTDLEVTNAIAGSITGNASTVTTNANLTGPVTSTGNATAIADSALSIAKTSGLQTALDGKITGPASATDNSVVRYDGTTGKLVQDSTVTILDSGNVGIGTTGPGLNLHVSGALGLPATSGTSQTGVFRVQGTGGQTVLDMGSDSANSRVWLQATAANDLSVNRTLLLNPYGGNVGIGTTGPDAKLDVLSTTEQLRLTYTDGSVYTSFTTGSGGDLTIAPSGGDTSITGNLAVSSTLELGHASDTTLSRSAAGVLAVEGTPLARFSKTTEASNATPTPTGGFEINHHSITALATAPTFAAPSGTPAEGNRLTIRIHDNGTARALAWNAIYTSTSSGTLPTTTVLGKMMMLAFLYDSTDSKWRCLGVSEES